MRMFMLCAVVTGVNLMSQYEQLDVTNDHTCHKIVKTLELQQGKIVIAFLEAEDMSNCVEISAENTKIKYAQQYEQQYLSNSEEQYGPKDQFGDWVWSYAGGG